MSEKFENFLDMADQLGLTKLEVVLALESVVLDANLYDKAKAKIEEMAEENNKLACVLCGDTGEVEEIDGDIYCNPLCVEDDTITMHAS